MRIKYFNPFAIQNLFANQKLSDNLSFFFLDFKVLKFEAILVSTSRTLNKLILYRFL